MEDGGGGGSQRRPWWVLAVLGPVAVLTGAVLAVRQDSPVEVSTASGAALPGAEGTTPTSTSAAAATTASSGPTTTVTEARPTTTLTAPRATTTQPAPTTTGPASTTTTTTTPSATTTAPRAPARLAFTDTDPGSSFAGYYLQIYDFATGGAQPVATNVSFYPSWSPDGRSLAYGDDKGIEVFDTTSGQHRLLSPPLSGNPPRRDTWPSWSPDGKRIAYIDGTGLSVMAADGSGRQHLADLGSANFLPSCRPAGNGSPSMPPHRRATRSSPSTPTAPALRT